MDLSHLRRSDDNPKHLWNYFIFSKFTEEKDLEILTLWMPRAYIYVLQWSSPSPQMFFTNNHGRVYLRPLVVRIMNTWSLPMLHGDVYIRPWLLMPKQRGIQREVYISRFETSSRAYELSWRNRWGFIFYHFIKKW